MPTRAQRASRVALDRRLASGLTLLAVVLGGCGGAEQAEYSPADVQRAFRAEGLVLQRVPSVGAEQPAMGEVSGCGTRYFARSAAALVAVSVCDGSGAAAAVASGRSMRRQNVAVEYAGSDRRVRDRIGRALDALGD